jgi:hypothetical protein
MSLQDFEAWFRKNYPGKYGDGGETVIHDPDFHSPRIFHAAKTFMTPPFEAQEKPGPCPVCCWPKSQTLPQRVRAYKRTGENHQVVCNKCRGRGPLAPTKEAAEAGWNGAKR